MTNSPVFSARLRSSGGKGSRKTESMVSWLFLVTVVSARAVARAARQIHTMAAQGRRRFKRLFINQLNCCVISITRSGRCKAAFIRASAAGTPPSVGPQGHALLGGGLGGVEVAG